jgi:hypothetical protein
MADWLLTWQEENEDDERPLLFYKGNKVGSTKKSWRRIGRELGIEGFSQYSFRHFMADQVRMLFRRVPRENRSLLLGHTVRDGSRTTGHYEGDDPLALADVALATDCVLALLAERCERNLFAIEVRFNRDDLLANGRAIDSKERDKIEERWWETQSDANPSLHPNSLLTGKLTGNFVEFARLMQF